MADTPNYLSRAEMEAVIRNKGSVLYGGEVITEMSKLPTEADLAVHDEAKRDQALANLRDQKKRIEEEEAKLLAKPLTKPQAQPSRATELPPETEEKPEADPNRPKDSPHPPASQSPQPPQLGARKLK